jgi:hypothetical protein
LRQASRRSWRIGQRSNVNVKFFYYTGTMQEACLRLMGKKLLVSLAMEGKFASDSLQAIDEGDDILMAMARSGSGSWRSRRKCSEFGPWRHHHRKWKQSLRRGIYQKSSFRRQHRSRQW